MIIQIYSFFFCEEMRDILIFVATKKKASYLELCSSIFVNELLIPTLHSPRKGVFYYKNIQSTLITSTLLIWNNHISR